MDILKIDSAGISCGMYLMPVIPFITDTCGMIETTVAKAKNAGIDFIIFGGLTLKSGRQKDYFIRFLKNQYPELVAKYQQIYGDENPWGTPDLKYISQIERIFDKITTKHKIPKRIPAKMFEGIVSPKELIIIILKQLDYLVKLKGNKSPYSYAAYTLSQIKKTVEEMDYDELLSTKGIGPFTAKLIREIIETKRCIYYENLL